MKILVVEDEAVLREGLCDLLRGARHEVEAVGDGAAAIDTGTRHAFDLVVLDRMMPKVDGLKVCQRLKLARPSLPILMLTARGSENDKVEGLLEGADDYVVKPFGARELLARVQALGRRAPRAGDERVELDGCVLDFGRCRVERGGTALELSAREVGLLRHLYANRERVVSRPELLERVWNIAPGSNTRTVDMAVANLRKKIEDDVSAPRVLVSVRGVGYAWGKR